MKAILSLFFLIGLAALGASKASQEPPDLGAPLGLEAMPASEENPFAREKVELGRRLFFDKLLSIDLSIACASCHKPELAFGDDRAISKGVRERKGIRNAPAIINRAYGKSMFWDGRIVTLEEQVLHPIINPVEMDLELEELIKRLEADDSYARQFKKAFEDGATIRNVALALASYVRTLRSGNSAFDKVQNNPEFALSAEAQRGLELFFGKASCFSCHSGPNFTDEEFHNTGVSWGAGDPGRFKVTRNDKDYGAFKTPTLREIERTAPYMHDGSIETLERVIDFYDRGGNPNPHMDMRVRPLFLITEEKRALLAFLKSLSGTMYDGAK